MAPPVVLAQTGVPLAMIINASLGLYISPALGKKSGSALCAALPGWFKRVSRCDLGGFRPPYGCTGSLHTYIMDAIDVFTSLSVYG